MKQRITRLIATLTLGTLAATGLTFADDLITPARQDTGWGAPDTTGIPVVDEAVGDAGTVIDTTLGDSGWG